MSGGRAHEVSGDMSSVCGAGTLVPMYAHSVLGVRVPIRGFFARWNETCLKRVCTGVLLPLAFDLLRLSIESQCLGPRRA